MVHNGIEYGLMQAYAEGYELLARGVATPVISAALYARFVSQDHDGIAMKAIAALREQFGGHAVLPEDAPGEDRPPVAPADPAAT
jgi:6-phosphogluconate dehydrogenase